MLAEVVNDDGTMARLPDLREFANAHDLALISIEQLIEYRRRNERQLSRQAQTRIPNAYGQWQAFGYRHEVDGTEYVALVLGDMAGPDVLTRLHSECLTGDVFGSLRCDCGAQLKAAMAAISAEGRGVVLYLRGHEGRGVGLLSKLQAYELQTPAPTRWTPTPSSACRWTRASTRQARRCSPTWACARCACSPTTRSRSAAWSAAAWTSPRGSRSQPPSPRLTCGISSPNGTNSGIKFKIWMRPNGP